MTNTEMAGSDVSAVATDVNRRVIQTRTGVPSEVVELERVEVPQPGPGELLVELVLAPINPAEVLMFEGNYGHRETVPALPRFAGIEGVGRVVGGATDAIPLGSLVSIAGVPPVFADYRVIPAASALVLPDDIDHESVAVAFVNTQAVLMMLHESPEIGAGDWIIQNAANSGYGRILDAVGAKRGIRVINVVRSESAAEIIRESAVGPVVLDGPDLEAQVAALTAGESPKLAIDAIGGEATNRLAATLAPGGRVLVYGLMSGEDCVVDTRLIVFGGIRVEGFWMPRSFPRIGAKALGDIAATALQYVREGGIDVPIEARYGLDDIAAALEHASRPGRTGKVVVTR
ncbi:zinc-dependent alcohol dehydrogenase family protein [Mycetocola sp. 2940]|uniref:zinc-dependent alcohol dehydrogenase family protein n=1 Tax=Mycetocola sp. 2940 TaxID=3156452 RepID=UPI003397C255